MISKTKAAIILALFALIVYSNSLGGQFVYDDEYFVVKNAAIRSLGNIPSFFVSSSAVAFSELSQDVYRPLTTLSYAIDYLLWRLNSFGYHLVNVALHSMNVVLVFLLFYTAFADPFLAFMTAIFFACHPVQTEAVSWISGRANVLFLFFYLMAFLFYIVAAKKGPPGRKKIFIAASLVAYSAALFSKEMAISLPLILISYDAHFDDAEPFRKRFYSRYAGYIIIALAFILVRSTVLGRVSQCGWWGSSPYHTLLTMLRVCVEYIKLMIMPADLCAFYTNDIYTSVANMKVLTALSALSLIAVLAVLAFRRARGVSFAVSWFFIALLPVSNIVPIRALMAERFLYLPSIGFCLLLAIAIERLGLAGARRKVVWTRIAAIAIAAFIVTAYSIRTMARNEEWKDSFTITSSILKLAPLNPWALMALGEAYSSQGRYEESIKPLQKAMALTDSYFAPRNILGFVYVEMGRYADAIKVLDSALKINPDNLEALNSLGVAYASVGKYEDALKQFRRSIEIDNTFVNAYINIGTTYDRMGDYDKALEEYGRVRLNTRSSQDMAVAYLRMGDIYVKTGRVEKAKEYYEKAMSLCGRGMDELKKIVSDRLNAKWET